MCIKKLFILYFHFIFLLVINIFMIFFYTYIINLRGYIYFIYINIQIFCDSNKLIYFIITSFCA